MSSTNRETREPTLLDALIPLVTLIALLALSVYLYGEDASYGANQIALIICAGIAALISVKNGLRWSDIEQGIARSIAVSSGAILILLAVGSLIGTWILSGTVPTLIYYGLHLLDPSFFYPAACLICALVAVSIGSSWTVAGTIGVALIGVSAGLGLSLPMTAGAVISGAYFGDKMSPLSDTTNLAPAVAGTELFTHIRHMLWTTVPSLAIALILFTIIGVMQTPDADAATLGNTLEVIQSEFRIGWYLILPVILVMYMAWKRLPAFPTILVGALVGGVFAVFFQPDQVLGQSPDGTGALGMISGVWITLFDGFTASTGNEAVDDLLSRGGMSSMLNTVWLILCAMAFGATMERGGLLLRLVRSTLEAARTTGQLIWATLATAIGANIVAADQYMAIVLPGRTYRLEFERRKLAPVNLSRALEDAGTLTSPLIPWNTCGAYMAATLGVPTLAYLPFCFFNLANPLIAAGYAWAGFRIVGIEDDTPSEPLAESTR